MWLLTLAVWMIANGSLDALVPRDIACLGERSVVGIDKHLRIVRYDGSRWRPSGISERVIELWSGPDGLLSWTAGPVVFSIDEATKATMRWQLPAAIAGPRFALLDGLVAVTPERMFRLHASGRVEDAGATPPSVLGRPAERGPLIFSSQGRLIACYGASVRKLDATYGHCLRAAPDGFNFAADFGERGDAGEGAEATPPFACGNVIISVHSGRTEAHAMSDGSLVASTETFARRGSACLTANRVLLVSRHAIGIFGLPQLRRQWRQDLSSPIRSAAAPCGTKVAVLLKTSSVLKMIDLPGRH